MKEQSAINSRFSDRNVKFLCGSTNGLRKIWLLLAVSSVLTLRIAADNSIDTRFNDLGNRVMCGCKTEPATGFGAKGCQQVLLKCDHRDCDTSGPMRNDLRAALQKGDKDDAILHSLVQKYGATLVVSSDTSTLFGIVVFVVLAAIVFLMVLVRKRRSHLAMVTTPVSDRESDSTLRHRVQEQTEKEKE